MRILLATYWHVPHLGGVWPYMEQKKEKLESLGHEVDLLGYGDAAGSFVHIVNKNQRVYTDQLLPLLKAKLNASAYPLIYEHALIEYAEFRRYIFELAVAYFGLASYDVIHTQDVISTVSINRVRPPQTALVATLHGCVAHEIRHHLEISDPSPSSQAARDYFDRMEYRGATSAEYTILANQWMKKILVDEFHVPHEKLKVFQYGFDIATFLKRMNQASELQRPNDKKVIIYTGRLVEIKGVHHLLDALGRLKEQCRDWVCWIFGDGDMQAELRLQSQVLGLENEVVFWGRRDDIPAILAQADIFVLPSLIENQPLSVIEAQLAGKAIVVSNAGGLPEIIQHGVTGLISPIGDPKSLCEVLKVLLENEMYRTKLGDQAKVWAASHWSLDHMVERLMEVYHQAIIKRKENANTL